MEYEGKLMQLLAKSMFAFADGVILQTRQCANFFPKRVQRKAVILPNPLNEQFLGKQYVGERRKTIVAVGRVDENKNHQMLIQAYEDIMSEYPEYQLVIYGDGDRRQQLLEYIREKKLTQKVSMPGKVKDVAAHIREAAVYVLTSNTEGMPNSLIEAMVLGLPVISTNCPCGGPETIIQDGVNGLLIPVGDTKALAEALKKILGNQEYACKLGENAAKLSEELHPDKVNRQWEQYLEGV